MENTSSIKKIVKLSRPILKRHGVIKAGLFGSYACGEQVILIY